MNLTKLILLSFLFLPISLLAQKDSLSYYKYAFCLKTDNDSYLLQGNDGYYTNGLFLDFSWADKKVNTVEIGQLMYNAKGGDYSTPQEIDRPVSALLFAKYNQTSFNKRGSVFQWNIMGGIMGPASGGEALQKFIHHAINAYTPSEWRYQLKSGFGLNAGFNWSTNLWRQTEKSSHMALKPVLQLNAGSFFDNFQAGFIFQWGDFEKDNQSVLWNARIKRPLSTFKRDYESFFYFYPRLTYQAYNATIQGDLFSHYVSGISAQPNRFVYKQQIGWLYANDHINFGPSLFFETCEAKSQIAYQWYGRIQLGYLFGNRH